MPAPAPVTMRFATPLTPGTLLKRYKRFLVDVQLDDGTAITAHCPNTGAMLTCSAPGSRVCLSRSDNPTRKYPHTLDMVAEGNSWVGVNTARTNALVTEAILGGAIAEFAGAANVAREVTTSRGTRLDLLVAGNEGSTYVEVKNCSLAIDGCAMFPDAVTSRGTKHLEELMRLAAAGEGAAVFFLVMRMDATRFAPARAIDPTYGEALVRACRSGVRALAYQAQVTPQGIEVVGRLPVEL